MRGNNYKIWTIYKNDELYTYNNEELWNLLKQIKGNSSNMSPEYQTLPLLNDLDKYYQTLLQKKLQLDKTKLSRTA